jgi:hypothetical protein
MSRWTHVVYCVAVGLLLVDARAASARQTQASPPRVAGPPPAALERYAQAALVVALASEGTANHRVHPPIGGTSTGVSIAVGGFVAPALAIEGEFVLEGATTTPQRFSYNWSEDFVGESRDLLFNANLRLHPRRARYLDLIGGGGVAVSRFAERSIIRTDYYPATTRSMLPDNSSSDVRPTVGGGADLRIPVGSKIELVPSFRMRWVRRADDGFAAYHGVGNYTYQFGASLRFKW